MEEQCEQGERAAEAPRAGGPVSTRTQILLAVLSLIGVLGAALITHWDSVFGRREASQPLPAGPAQPAGGGTASASGAARPVAEAVTSNGAASPVVKDVNGNVTINIGGAAPPVNAAAAAPESAGPRLTVGDMIGDWESTAFKAAYDDAQLVVRLRFEHVYGEVVGSLVEFADGRREPESELFNIKSDGTLVTFETHGLTCCNAANAEEPYQTLYTLRRTDVGIGVARHNTVDTGGKTERFLLHRVSVPGGKTPQAAGSRHSP